MQPRPATLCVCLLGCGRVAFDPRTDASSDAFVVECEADPRLVACYDFEGDTADRSGTGNDAAGSAYQLVPGPFGRALRTTTASRLDLLAPTLTMTRFTLEMWLRPEPMIMNGIAFDHDGHWALVLRPAADGFEIICDSGMSQVLASTHAHMDVWTNVRCTNDGTTLTVYVDGIAEGNVAGSVRTGTGSAAIAGNAPPSDPAAPYLGSLDRLRIWSVALAPTDP